MGRSGQGREPSGKVRAGNLLGRSGQSTLRRSGQAPSFPVEMVLKQEEGSFGRCNGNIGSIGGAL